MKKILLLTVLALSGFATVNAQEVKFGAKAGFNIASIYGDNSNKYGDVTGLHFGLVSEIPVSTKFSFQPELMFSGQGYDLDGDLVALNYLNVPLMGKYYLTKGLSIEAGPQIGFLLSAKKESTNVKDGFNTVDLGVNFGLGYKLDNGLNFGARYNVGLSNISDFDGGNIKNHNGVLQVSVGYFFL